MNYDAIAETVRNTKLEYMRTGVWHEGECAELIKLTRSIPLYLCFQRGIPENDIDDIIQTAYQEVFARLPNLADDRSFPRYLYVISLNLCRHFWKKSMRSGTSVNLDDCAIGEIEADYVDRLESRHLCREDLRDAIGKLSESYREVICLYYFGGFTTGEIAKMQNSCINTVTSKLGRARRMLRDIMEETS